MKAAAIIYQLGVLVSVLVEITQPYENTGWQENECRRLLREAKSAKVEAQIPPRLSGHWTSSGCETRPGPEFVLRKYLFRRSSFNAQLYYYTDDACTIATHSITAKGSFRPMRNSWRTPGAYEANYRLSQVIVIPYTSDKANYFRKVVHRHCKPIKGVSIKPFRKFKIFQFTKYSKENKYVDESDFDCSNIFNFTMNELQLVRVERRHLSKFDRTNDVIQSQARSRVETELLLGDVSTNMKYRQQYRPTYYQVPLKKSKTVGCDVCAKIAASSQWNPPVLVNDRIAFDDIVGDWISNRCETRPNGQYLTRYLTFLPGDRSWVGIYDFYKDPLCQDPNFSLDVKGNYVRGHKSRVLQSTNTFVFRITRLKVTPRNFQMVQYLNSYSGKGCGKANAWKLGVTQDVTSTRGCVTLGIQLPNTEYDIMKSETQNGVSYLYIGQRPSDFSSMSVRRNMPTSFQTPLIKCGNDHPDNNLLEPTPNLTMYLVARNTGSNVNIQLHFVSQILITAFLLIT